MPENDGPKGAIGRIEQKLTKIDTALAGYDGSGGILKEVRDIKKKLESVDDKVEYAEGRADLAVNIAEANRRRLNLQSTGSVVYTTVVGTVIGLVTWLRGGNS